MNLPILIQALYGRFTFTGLYSFEFVDKNRNTITEIFFMVPPKSKSVSEPTRSSTVPTLGGNYNIDGGNATKQISLSGKLYFPYVGSPDNPVAKNNIGLDNSLTGLEEFLKLRWMLVRYRDYTMTFNSNINVPTNIITVSSEINALYKKISQKIKNKTGALYDEIKIIFHDYDMDDHFYCRIDNFSSNQVDTNHIAIEYTISLECYEPAGTRSELSIIQVKPTTNENIDSSTKQLNVNNYEESFDNIQSEIGFNVEFVAAATTVQSEIENIITENENIQSGKSTATSLLPIYTKRLNESATSALDFFIDTFLSNEQQQNYNNGDTTIDDLIDNDLLDFYNVLQKTKLQSESLQGILNSIPALDDLRYSSNADEYTLTEEQFDSNESDKVENTTNFFYYTVLEGDTSRIIALRELKDSEKFINILKINEISENDFIDGNLIGQQIKIPIDINVIARSEDNLVYETDFNNIEKFLFGSDINSGLNNELIISAKGDLLQLDGIENVYKNIENRIENNKGSLNIFNPDYGTISIDDGNTPLLVKLNRYLTDVVSQIQIDPRVESVQMDLKQLKFENEIISVPTKIFFIGVEENREVIING